MEISRSASSTSTSTSSASGRTATVAVLKSRLLELEQQKQQDELTAERRGMVGSGERSEKVRTYNYPQNRVTDHRINLTLHKLDQIVQGDLNELVGALRAHRQATLLQQDDPDA